MSTKTMKILTMVASILLVVSLGATTVFGLTPDQLDGSKSSAGTSEDLVNLGHDIVNILQTVGIVVSVVIIIILGLKYMMGSAEEKADYKKTMIPYLVGAAFIFLAPTIANIVYDFFEKPAA